MRDDYRPSEAQITDLYECNQCRQSAEAPSGYDPGKCACGGKYVTVGYSHPANVDDWDEQRDPDGVWRERR